MTVLNHAVEAPSGKGEGTSERPLGPAFAKALGGGAVVLVLTMLLYVLGVAMAEWLAGTPHLTMSHLAAAPMYREFLGLFLATFLTIFIAREFDVRTR